MSRSDSPISASSRGEGRPVRRRTRTFRPNYLSFAATYQCNLDCAHCCVPIEWPDRLDIGAALAFLEDAHREGIAVLGFTGGEPFLYFEFVEALCRRAAELGFRFDKIMSNGVWHEDAAELQRVLTRLAATGFGGKLGLSVDKFHGKHTSKAAEFCRVARRVFRRDNIVSLSYASRRPDLGLEPVQELARELEAVVEWSDVLRRYLLVSDELTMTLNWNHLAPVERAERFTGAWDGEWFAEDYCEGPGQALIVTPKGEVKPCCGFASDLDQLTIGNIYRESVRRIIRRARRHPYVGKVFREGLTAIRDEILARDPRALPGATSNHCYFCWYVLTRGLAAGVSGGGGQVGEWTGARPNRTGELLQIGLPKRAETDC
ncbi:MAG TPA: radical SAM protein [Gemmataceae bacterium]|jgi:pyruvate-formate lyase-activating enzyme